MRISLLPGDTGLHYWGRTDKGCSGQQDVGCTPHQLSSGAIPDPSPSLQLQRGSHLSQTLESTEGQREESPANPQEGTVLGAAHMYFHNPDFFCSVCSHISINKQALTLPVDALNALLHSKHGNELVTWKVLSLTWAVHVQRGKKTQSHKYNNLCRNLSVPPFPE